MRSFTVLDKIAARSHEKAREPAFSNEAARRKSLVPQPPATDSQCLFALAKLIAYSQNARSDLVEKMIDAGNLRTVFGDFDVARVAALDANAIVESHWQKIKVIRFQRKVKSIVGVAAAMNRLKKDGMGLREHLGTFPARIQKLDDIDKFWEQFSSLQMRLRAFEMPFFGRMTSLLHLLLHFGFDCVKPDLIVQQVAQKYGLLSAKPSDDDLEKLVREVQKYSLSRAIRPAVVDFYFLVEGGQTSANQFVK